jgi:hypothetical protein
MHARRPDQTLLLLLPPQGVDGPKWNCASRVAAEEEECLAYPSVCLSVCLSVVCITHHHILLTSITDPPHMDYFHYGFLGGGGGDLRASFLSFFLSLRACVSKGYVKVLKYSGALVSAYLSLTLISACPCLLLTLGDAMTDERVHHTGICCCCCLCCCF